MKRWIISFLSLFCVIMIFGGMAIIYADKPYTLTELDSKEAIGILNQMLDDIYLKLRPATSVRLGLVKLSQAPGTSETILSQNASSIIFIPFGVVSSTQVQKAIEELATEKLDLTGGTILGPVSFVGSSFLGSPKLASAMLISDMMGNGFGLFEMGDSTFTALFATTGTFLSLSASTGTFDLLRATAPYATFAGTSTWAEQAKKATESVRSLGKTGGTAELMGNVKLKQGQNVVLTELPGENAIEIGASASPTASNTLIFTKNASNQIVITSGTFVELPDPQLVFTLSTSTICYFIWTLNIGNVGTASSVGDTSLWINDIGDAGQDNQIGLTFDQSPTGINEKYGYTAHYIITLSSGTHEASIRVRSDGGDIPIKHRRLTMLGFPQ